MEGNHSVMFPVVSNLYKSNLIPDTYLNTAISLKWITEEEKQEIITVGKVTTENTATA